MREPMMILRMCNNISINPPEHLVLILTTRYRDIYYLIDLGFTLPLHMGGREPIKWNQTNR
jgi:hypothetical protein